MGGAGLILAAALAGAACGRPVEVAVAPAAPSAAQRLAKGVSATAIWTLSSDEASIGDLVWLDHAAGEGRNTAGDRLSWSVAGAQPSAFRAGCPAPAGVPGPPAAAPEPPRIRGYRYIGSRPLPASAFRWVGLWRATEGAEESLVVAFESSAVTVRTPYVVLVRTPEPLASVSAAGEPRASHLEIAAMTRAQPGGPARLHHWRWRVRAMTGVPLD